MKRRGYEIWEDKRWKGHEVEGTGGRDVKEPHEIPKYYKDEIDWNWGYHDNLEELSKIIGEKRYEKVSIFYQIFQILCVMQWLDKFPTESVEISLLVLSTL